MTNKEVLSEKESGAKAYPDDGFCAWDPWQLVDFMRALGLTYPFDDDEGELLTEHVGSFVIATPKGAEDRKLHAQRAEEGRKAWEYFQEHGSYPEGFPSWENKQ